jgi:hypothetical protein
VSTCARRLGDFSKGKFCNGGKSGLGERKSQRVNCTEVSYKFLYLYVGCSGVNRVCTCRLQWAQSCMYAGCSKVNHVYAGCSEAQSRMYAGCSKVNHVHRTRFSGQGQGRTG